MDETTKGATFNFDDFYDASKKLENWVRELAWKLGSQPGGYMTNLIWSLRAFDNRISRNGRFVNHDNVMGNALEVLIVSSAHLDSVAHVVHAWEDRIISSDPAGSAAVATATPISSQPTAHQWAVKYMYRTVSSFEDKFRTFPDDISEWGEDDKVRLSDWIVSRDFVQRGERFKLLARLRRERAYVVNIYGEAVRAEPQRYYLENNAPRNDPTPAQVEAVRSIISESDVKNPTVEAIRKQVRAKGIAMSNEKLGMALKIIRNGE